MSKEFVAKSSLRGKLTKSILGILAVTFLVTGVVVFLSIQRLSSSFQGLSEKRTDAIRSELEDFSVKSEKRITHRYSDEMKGRALSLAQKDASSLVPPFQDNSFAQVKEFIQKVYMGDKDIVRAGFYVVEGGNILAWHYVDPISLRVLKWGPFMTRKNNLG